MTLAFFALGVLDLLPDTEIKDRAVLIDWIYAHQITAGSGGFRLNLEIFNSHRGSLFSGAAFEPNGTPSLNEYDESNIAMTYAALVSLLVVGDYTFSRLDRQCLLTNLKQLQHSNGGFASVINGLEVDMRFVYCACAISFMLNDWSAVDIPSVVGFITRSLSYDGGFGQGPDLESHGGSTYCAIASLSLLKKLDVIDKAFTLQWCIYRQVDGFCGRINKDPDTCYTFWIGASLKILGGDQFVNVEALMTFLNASHTSIGGFGKHEDCHPDLLHSYMAVAGLSIFDTTLGLPNLFYELNLGMNHYDKLMKLR